jgi:hypothetical protein
LRSLIRLEQPVQEVISSFVEYRYPSDYRDDAPLPDDFEEGIEITGFEIAGSIYVEATDAEGHGDGTGELNHDAWAQGSEDKLYI